MGSEDARTENRPPLPAVFAVVALTIASIGLSARHRITGPDFHRGIQEDELISVQNYTWAGVNSDGTRHQIDRLSDLRDLKAPAPSQLAIGLYASLGRWPEPNNHVVHSLLLNGTLPLVQDRDIGLRLPALMGAVGFAFGVALVCWRCRWHSMAILAGLLAFWHPYVVAYSQEARGYSLMLLLLVAFLLACHRLAGNPASIVTGSALVLIAVAIVENTVNMAVDWVAPCYLLLIAFPRLFDSAATAPASNDSRRKPLLIQGLCIALAGFVFLVDRLPYVYSSSQQYGLPFRTAKEFFELLANSLHYLFSSPALVIFGLLGCAGAALALREKPSRGFVALSCVAVLATVFHFAAARRFAYERNLGFWILPVLLGYACLGQRVINLPRKPWQRLAVGTAVYLGSIAFLLPGVRARVTDSNYESFRDRIHELPSQGETPSVALLGNRVPAPIQLDFPANWLNVLPAGTKPGGNVDLLLVEKGVRVPLGLGSESASQNVPPPDWPQAETLVREEAFSIVRLPCRVAPASAQPPARAILLWYPSFEAVSVSPAAVEDFLAKNKIAYHEIITRYQAKLEVFGQLKCVVAAGTTAGETRRIHETLIEAGRRFGGEALLLVPRE